MGSCTKVIIATHKPCWVPSDSLYLPVHVGKALNPQDLGFVGDNTGDNISAANGRYCELTGLYWAWKNVDADYLGLVHYRRFFKGSGENQVLTAEETAEYLSRAPIIVPRRRHYFIETVRSHYSHTFDGRHLDLAREAIGELAPQYLAQFDRHMGMRTAHIFNMMVMRRDLIDAYCSWLFPILDYVDERIDYSSLTPFEARLQGRISERLLDVWIDTNEHPYVECPFVYLEHVNWLKKGGAFLAAKFLGKKYKRSF